MRYFLPLILLTIALELSGQMLDSTHTLLANLARERSAALVAGDSLRMKKILDESFYYVNSNGIKRNRQEYIRNMFLPGDSKWLGQQIDSMHIKLVGNDAALLSFIVLDQFQFEGKSYSVYNRSTFVYEKKGNEWKCIAGHTTEIGK